jgi:small subunit ribosomal protein S8
VGGAADPERICGNSIYAVFASESWLFREKFQELRRPVGDPLFKTVLLQEIFMSMTDPIADFLTRIRNAQLGKFSKVDIPASNLLKEMTRIMMEEGYILNFTMIEDEKQGVIRIYLKYNEQKKAAISGLTRISRPGLRKYADVRAIPRVLNGLGIAILSTSKGVLTDKQAKKENVGGEVLCYIW